MIRVKIVPNDTKTVAKLVIVDSKDRVLFLKRSNYVKKYAGEWDLPGGHLKANESLQNGLSREVKEETGLDIKSADLLKTVDNIHYFVINYNSQPIKISHEHVEYKFFDKNELDSSQKFQNIALTALEVRK